MQKDGSVKPDSYKSLESGHTILGCQTCMTAGCKFLKLSDDAFTQNIHYPECPVNCCS